MHLLFCVFIAFIPLGAHAFELQLEPVADNAYAIVGETGPRTPENHAMNNTLGFVVTHDGVVLVGSGASPAGARLVEQAVANTTNKPIRLVINIGVQDHHWLGNSYFAEKGIPVKALKRTVDNQHQQVEAQLTRLHAQLGDETRTITPIFASEVVDADQQEFCVGGVKFKLLWPGDGHFAGDAVLWLPATRTLFTGDYVFHERMLGVHPTTPVTSWQQSFHTIEQLEPLHVVPGHGHPGNLNRARRDTGNYLDWLVKNVKQALGDWKEMDETIDELSDAPQFRHLQHYDSWHRRNIHQTYLQMEIN